MAQDILGSAMSSTPNLKDEKRGYGQGGFGGASSDLPGENTKSELARDCPTPGTSSTGQTRTVSGTEYATAHGMKHRDDSLALGKPLRPVTRR